MVLIIFRPPPLSLNFNEIDDILLNYFFSIWQRLKISFISYPNLNRGSAYGFSAEMAHIFVLFLKDARPCLAQFCTACVNFLQKLRNYRAIFKN